MTDVYYASNKNNYVGKNITNLIMVDYHTQDLVSKVGALVFDGCIRGALAGATVL